jgi:hypothetical protein
LYKSKRPFGFHPEDLAQAIRSSRHSMKSRVSTASPFAIVVRNVSGGKKISRLLEVARPTAAAQQGIKS